MTLYETLFVVHPEKAPRVKEFVERFKKIVEGQDGIVSSVDDWGLRDLAYRIEKQGKGHYTLLQYRSTARAVEELERNLRLTDGIMRYLTVRAVEAAQSESPAASRGRVEEQKVPPEEESVKTESQT